MSQSPNYFNILVARALFYVTCRYFVKEHVALS